MRKKELIKKIEELQEELENLEEKVKNKVKDIKVLEEKNSNKIDCLKDFLSLKIKSFNKPEISLDILEKDGLWGYTVFDFNLEILSNVTVSIIPITSIYKKELLKEYSTKEIYNLKLENVEYYSNGIKFMFLNKEYYLAMNEDGTPKEVFLIGDKEK